MKIYSDDIGMEFGIEKCAMLTLKSEKKTNVERHRTTKWRKNQNVLRKRNLEILGNIGRRHHETSD